MKKVGRIGMFLVVLTLCLPSYGEILVYKCSHSRTEYTQVDQTQWEVETGRSKWKSYLILEVDYSDNSIVQAGYIDYTEDGQKRFEPVNADVEHELVRVVTITGVTWAVVVKVVELDGDEVTRGEFALLTGAARARNVGSGTNREVANKLTGHSLHDLVDEGNRQLQMAVRTHTLYPAWTYWANGAGDDKGNQDFDATVDMIRAYLLSKGYTEKDDN